MIAAVCVDQPKDMLRLAEDSDNVGTLNDHGRMRSRGHPGWTGGQALRIGILGVIDVLISLRSVWCQNELFTGQRVLGDVTHRPTKPDTSQVRVSGRRLSIAFVPPGPDRGSRLAGLR